MSQASTMITLDVPHVPSAIRGAMRTLVRAPGTSRALLLLGLIGTLVLGLIQLAPPRVVPASAPASQFSAERAMADLRAIAAQPRFTVFVVGLSFAAAWLRLRSGSVWPPVLLHASHNLFVLNVFAPVIAEKRTQYLLTGEGGLLLAIVGIVLGVAFWLLRSRVARAGMNAPDAGATAVPATSPAMPASRQPARFVP